jgi:hypothetical protein
MIDARVKEAPEIAGGLEQTIRQSCSKTVSNVTKQATASLRRQASRNKELESSVVAYCVDFVHILLT